MISYGIYLLFNLIILLLFIRVLLTWFPDIDWYKEPFNSLKKFTDFFLEPFKRIVPPIGMLDLSPIAAFVVIEVIGRVLCFLFERIGL